VPSRYAAWIRVARWGLASAAAAYLAALVALATSPFRAVALPRAVDPWPLLALVAAGPAAWALRWARWHLYARGAGARVGWRADATVFWAGLGLAATPGKVGEFVRAWLLWRRHGLEPARGVAAVLADRLTDGAAMVVLAGAAWAALGRPRVGLAVALLPAAAWPLLAAPWGAGLLGRTAARRGWGAAGARGLETLRRLLAPRTAGPGLALALLDWAVEATGPVAVAAAAGLRLPYAVALAATTGAGLAGAASGLPGGIGAAEGAMAAVLRAGGEPWAMAAASVWIARALALWLPAAVGLATLLGGRPRSEAEGEERGEGDARGQADGGQGQQAPGLEVAHEVTDGEVRHHPRDEEPGQGLVEEPVGAAVQVVELQHAGGEDDRGGHEEREPGGRLVAEADREPADHGHAGARQPGDEGEDL
jgi:uncharacterized membrane protein YbhN (UPF0104 family)